MQSTQSVNLWQLSSEVLPGSTSRFVNYVHLNPHSTA
jgi:hypothetical protein